VGERHSFVLSPRRLGARVVPPILLRSFEYSTSDTNVGLKG
jgi:hypothetical protein